MSGLQYINMYTIDFIVLLMSGIYIYITYVHVFFKHVSLYMQKIHSIFIIFVRVKHTITILLIVHAAMFQTKDLLKMDGKLQC